MPKQLDRAALEAALTKARMERKKSDEPKP